MKKDGLYDVTVANPSRGCSMIYEGLPNAPSPAHGACSAAATELRRSRCCDGAAHDSSVALILRIASRRDALSEERRVVQYTGNGRVLCIIRIDNT